MLRGAWALQNTTCRGQREVGRQHRPLSMSSRRGPQDEVIRYLGSGFVLPARISMVILPVLLSGQPHHNW